MAAFTFVTSAKGGGLVPVEYANQIICLAAENSAALSMGTRFNMGSSQEVVPVTSVLPTASFAGAGTAIGVTVPEWTGKYLVAAKIGAIIGIEKELWEDSSFDIEADLIPKAAQSIGKVIDDAIFLGTNKSSLWTCDDMVTSCTAKAMVVTETEDIVTDVNDLMQKVEANNYDVNGFLLINAHKAALRQARTADGYPIYQPMTAGQPANLYGERLQFSKNGSLGATCKGVVGDWSKLIVGVRNDIRITMSEDAMLVDGAGTTTSAFQNDLVALKVTARFAFQIADVAGAYPFAVLAE